MSVIQSSTWVEVDIAKQFPKLDRDIETDVAIIGGGLVGLLCAYTLAKAGKRVAVLEKDRVGQGVTAYTTAFLTQIIDTDIDDLKQAYGRRNVELIFESHGQAIDLIEKIVNEEKIDCEFMRCPNFSYINKESEKDSLEEEYHLIKQFLPDTELHFDDGLKIPNFGYIEIKNQAKFHPLKFINGLLTALERLKVEIYEETEVEEVGGEEWVSVQTESWTVSAQYSLTATYDPLNNPKQTFMKKGMYKTYVYELSVPAGLIPEALYEDFNNPYHYFRIDRGEKHDRMIIGGEDNRKEFEFDREKNYRALREYINDLLAGHEHRIVRKWGGPILEPSDGLALIGAYEPHRLVATAFSGNGMTYSAISALLIADIVLKQKNPWQKLYDPKRPFKMGALAIKARDYISEFLNGVVKNTINR
jgi:glycine/D-amino acid oxidase-like deaminating enzyme